MRRKYPDHRVAIKIEQEGLKVRMIIEPVTGKPDIIERAAGIETEGRDAALFLLIPRWYVSGYFIFEFSTGRGE